MDVDSPPDWAPIAEATHIVGRSERTLRRWVAEDRIPHTKDGRRILVDVSLYRQAPPGMIMDATGMQAQVSYLQNQVDTLQQVIERQDNYIGFLQEALATALRVKETKAIPEPRRFRWPWQRD